ncbi:hypothetical protein F2P79_006534 [Pimephales promelas]|nr:hypothetical protein F2P79_006534 [Pimephales promelas]
MDLSVSEQVVVRLRASLPSFSRSEISEVTEHSTTFSVCLCGIIIFILADVHPGATFLPLSWFLEESEGGQTTYSEGGHSQISGVQGFDAIEVKYALSCRQFSDETFQKCLIVLLPSNTKGDVRRKKSHLDRGACVRLICHWGQSVGTAGALDNYHNSHGITSIRSGLERHTLLWLYFWVGAKSFTLKPLDLLWTSFWSPYKDLAPRWNRSTGKAEGQLVLKSPNLAHNTVD